MMETSTGTDALVKVFFRIKEKILNLETKKDTNF